MVKETKEYQDAEGRMGEEPHAPRTNPENTEISDPEKSGFDLDPSDGMAHDSPSVTTDTSPETFMKLKPKAQANLLQRKMDGLDKNYNELQNDVNNLQT